MNKKQILYPDNPNGIYLYETPMINGIRQYVQVRGKDKHNPLILFLHGGPGGSVAGVCHIHQAGWEEHFTVVNWDQRNTCKTYLANKDRAKEIAQTGTMEDYIKDIDEVIAYLHTVYDFEKLILMGFSWGTEIGSEYAKRHPEHLLCYIGVGQSVHYRDGVMLTCRKLLDRIPKESTDTQKVQKMLDEFPEHPIWNSELFQCMRYFTPLCMKYIMKHAKRISPVEILKSPFMNLREKMTVLLPNYSMLTKSYETMLAHDFRDTMHYEVPVLFVFGEEETVCPSELLEECFDELSAPNKKLVVIPNASHACYLDQPDEFNRTVTMFLDNLN